MEKASSAQSLCSRHYIPNAITQAKKETAFGFAFQNLYSSTNLSYLLMSHLKYTAIFMSLKVPLWDLGFFITEIKFKK